MNLSSARKENNIANFTIGNGLLHIEKEKMVAIREDKRPNLTISNTTLQHKNDLIASSEVKNEPLRLKRTAPRKIKGNILVSFSQN